MSIVTYEIDSTPRGIIKRLERKNCKNDLARTLQQVRSISFDDQLNETEKLKQIKEKIFDRLF